MGSNYRLFTTAETRISFSYSFLNIDHCISDHTVNITVYGINQAGEGESAFVQAIIPQSQSENCSEGIYTRDYINFVISLKTFIRFLMQLFISLVLQLI